MNRLTGSSLLQLTRVRFLLFFREPEVVFWIFVFPILLSIGLSIAFRNRPADILPVSATTAKVTRALASDKGLTATTLDQGSGAKALATGKILLLAVETPTGVTFEYDNTNPDARTARLIAYRAVQSSSGQRESVPVTDSQVSAAGSRYIDFVVPGLLGMNLMSSAMWGLGFAIVEARQKKLLKRLVASPMPRWQYLASFLLSRLLLLVVEVGVFLCFAKLVFGVPLRGSIWQLGLVCVLASLSFSALGLLVASRAKTIEAASGLMNVLMLPMWIVSGVFFSADRFPHAIQPVVRALPLTAAIDALRGNMLQGTSVLQMVTPLSVLLLWLVVAFSVALRIFRWR